MQERSVGIVLPAYRPDWEQTLNYVKELREELDPGQVILEVDAERPGVNLPEDVETVFSQERRGKGAAVSDGFDRLETDLLVFADADGSVPPGSVSELVERIGEGLAIGSRRHENSMIIENQTRLRKSLGDVFSVIASSLLPLDIRDYQCGAKVITSGAWSDVRGEVKSDGFAWDLELVTEAYRKGYSIEEVPVRWNDREGSTVPVFRTSLEMLRQLRDSWRRL